MPTSESENQYFNGGMRTIGVEQTGSEEKDSREESNADGTTTFVGFDWSYTSRSPRSLRSFME